MKYDPKEVQAYQWLHPDPLWNATERHQNQLPDPVKVEDVRKAQCQTGLLFHVTTKSGEGVWLDAGWFVGIAR